MKCPSVLYCLCAVSLIDICVGFVKFTQLRMKITKPVIENKLERRQEFMVHCKFNTHYFS